jgi:hypothetical protein
MPAVADARAATAAAERRARRRPRPTRRRTSRHRARRNRRRCRTPSRRPGTEHHADARCHSRGAKHRAHDARAENTPAPARQREGMTPPRRSTATATSFARSSGLSAAVSVVGSMASSAAIAPILACCWRLSSGRSASSKPRATPCGRRAACAGTGRRVDRRRRHRRCGEPFLFCPAAAGGRPPPQIAWQRKALKAIRA